ncbi:MAG TPA: hypothetical protein VFX17_03270 [Patescibacteria group bacterium]|nr:hypothetical protein [Patescibacteria group bacterium]
MQETFLKTRTIEESLKEPREETIRAAILKTMAFFSLYELPVNLSTIHQLLYKARASFEQVSAEVAKLTSEGRVQAQDGLYALKSWDEGRILGNKKEIGKRWRKVWRYFWVLSLVPFVDQISVINSLALGNADHESDIDFFVVTAPGKLYLVRSIIIAVFRILGVYKTRQHVNERFCFGFYVSSDHESLEDVLVDGEDPLFAFWFASFAPILNQKSYLHLVGSNRWINDYFPNFDPGTRLAYIKQSSWLVSVLKRTLEILLVVPAFLLEPLLRSVHIRHTFNLPENHWPTSTTIANQSMLKLHALDPRVEIREKFYEALKSLR